MNENHDKLKLLVVDDSEINRGIFIEMLDGFDILEAEDGYQAIDLIKKYESNIALILLDIVMPKLDGYGVLEEMNRLDLIGSIPVIVISSATENESIYRAYELGATDFLQRNTDVFIFRKRISNAIQLFAQQKTQLKTAVANTKTLEILNRRLATEDDLIGCNNLHEFIKVAGRLIRENHEYRYALWYCDIKQFKLINNKYGYGIGDYVLHFWADMIEEDIDDDETYGRINADCFVLLTKYECDEQLDKRFKTRVAEVGTCLKEKGINYKVEISAGVYITRPEDKEDPDINKMLDYANLAKQGVKNIVGSHWGLYDDKMLEQELKKNEISKNLTEAIKNGEIRPYFQPQYDYSTGKFTGAEALCRWIHHSMGFLSPGEFIPVLEKNGQIFELDCYIWDEVCRYLRRWHDMGYDVSASVNISRIDVQEPALYDIFCSMIEKHNIEPAWLHLEVTESAYMEDSKLLKGVVTRLMDRGFIVEMDDFGSGYSSLTILKELPVDTIKLDYTFIRDALYDPRGDAIMNSIIRMSSYLNIEVIAEGVENVENADHLLNMGCHLMQGYYFAKPMPAADFEELMKRMSIASSQTRKKNENLDVIRKIVNKDNSYIFNNLLEASAMFNYDGVHIEAIYTNNKLYDLIDCEYQDMNNLRYNLMDILPEKDRVRVIKAVNEAVKNGSSKCYMNIINSRRRCICYFTYICSYEDHHMLNAQFADITDIDELLEEYNS